MARGRSSSRSRGDRDSLSPPRNRSKSRAPSGAGSSKQPPSRGNSFNNNSSSSNQQRGRQLAAAGRGAQQTGILAAYNHAGQLVPVHVDYDRRVIQKQPPPVEVHAVFVIDASGSMGERVGPGMTRMSVVLEEMRNMTKDILLPDDRLTLAFFNNQNYHQMWYNVKVSKAKEYFSRVQNEANSLLGGGTNLWDSVLTALGSMQKTEHGNQDNHGNTVLRFMVVFTDGEDNTSKKTNLPNVVQEVRKPGFGNFHLLNILVGASMDIVSTVQSAFQKLSHVRVIAESQAGSNAISKAFGRAHQALRKAYPVLEERFQVVIRQRGANARPMIPDLIHNMGGLQIGAGRPQSALPGPSRRISNSGSRR